ncbi:hypothetical protein [Glycomyces terrestris]|uniref:Uncharacterized protein n=1 Tax=Glycomyces terrestris TaxID=2493553 RepID=A0A426UTM7_9ACTN|nr:hypothetical protein [Glycomyces terrestris]RRR97320.1 hypothetical protein EIW28_18075 [Glycomyces terrestris]
MTDEWDAGDEADFGEDFFYSLEAAPDAEPQDAGAADGVFDGDAGADEFQYEAEGDGSFETEAAAEEFPEEFDAEDYPFDLGGEG